MLIFLLIRYVWSFVCLGFLPSIQECFTHMWTSHLPLKEIKFWPIIKRFYATLAKTILLVKRIERHRSFSHFNLDDSEPRSHQFFCFMSNIRKFLLRCNCLPYFLTLQTDMMCVGKYDSEIWVHTSWCYILTMYWGEGVPKQIVWKQITVKQSVYGFLVSLMRCCLP